MGRPVYNANTVLDPIDDTLIILPKWFNAMYAWRKALVNVDSSLTYCHLDVDALFGNV